MNQKGFSITDLVIGIGIALIIAFGITMSYYSVHQANSSEIQPTITAPPVTVTVTITPITITPTVTIYTTPESK